LTRRQRLAPLHATKITVNQYAGTAVPCIFEVVYRRQGSSRRVLAARHSDCYGCPSFKGGGDFGSNQHFTGWGPDLLEQRKRVGHRGLLNVLGNGYWNRAGSSPGVLAIVG